LAIATCTLVVAACARFTPPHAAGPVVRMMEVTAYCPCGDCCGWRRTCFGTPVYASGPRRGERKEIGLTSTGKTAQRGTIAADPTRYPYGTIMQIEGYGRGVVEDCGGAIKGDHIDIFFETHREALEWGRKRIPVKVWFMPPRRGNAWLEPGERMNGDSPAREIPGIESLAALLTAGVASPSSPLAETAGPVETDI